MAPNALPADEKARLRKIQFNAQTELHAMWNGGQKDAAHKIYLGAKAHVQDGGSAGNIAEAKRLIAGKPGLTAWFAEPGSKHSDAKTGLAPGRVKPDDIQTGPVEGIGELAEDLNPLVAIEGFLSVLTNRNTWLRVGEGLLGILLVGVGVIAITRGTPVGSAVKKAVKATPAGRITKVVKK